nr:BamA/TamA family outer membrane protein [Vibrio sp. S11_S32]
MWFHSELGAKEKTADKIIKGLLGEDSTSSALGVVAEFDTRNNLFFPTSGMQVTGEYQFYCDAFGSDYDYDTSEINGQFFIPLATK